MKPVVMFVDDELNVLMGLERALHTMREAWEMVFYANPEEALEHVKSSPVDLVVSDLRMPGMNGAVFLGEVAERAPRTIRFIMADIKDKSKALDLGGLCHQFLPKPCDRDMLVKLARRALAARTHVPDKDLQAKIAQVRELPSRSDIHELILKELGSETPSTDSIAALTSEDIALSAKVLQLGSSAFFGDPDDTPSLFEAVNRLGVPRIKAVVRSHMVETECAPKTHDDFSLESLWLHSVACANVGQAIAASQNMPTKAVESAFIAGLLHDVGRLVMAASEPELYIQTMSHFTDQDSVRGLAEETKIFKSPHPAVGAYLIGLWGFNDDIVNAVAYHHTPSACPVREFGSLAILHAAEAFCHVPDEFAPSERAELDSAYYADLALTDQLPSWRAVAGRMFPGAVALETPSMPERVA